MSNLKQNIHEVEQPQSQGEKNFKDMHKAINHKNLVPGITDQEHVFTGSTKPYDNKFHTGYKPGEDRAAYDKGLKMDDKLTDNGYETAHVEEAHSKDHPGFAAIAKKAAERYHSKKAGERVAGAILAKMHHKEEVQQTDINEKISASTPTKDVIHDFVHSDNPKFAGKSTKERIKMALGAKYGMMKKEEFSLEENYDDTPEEVSMIRTELKAIVIKAQDLLDHMPTNMHVEPWVQSKVAVAKEMVSGVHDYMLYSDDAGQPDEVNQVPPMSGMSNMASMASMTPYSMSNEEKELSPKQKKIAALAGDPKKIDADDFKALRAGKKIEEKMSPEELKKFAAIAPPKDKITQADKIMAAKMAAKKK